jgi:2,4-dienoyl-CoA reductase-like NADH-dependent reductase (Old Yellow Enzyme family)
LINQFLSPLTNRRKDEYGGEIESRCRFLMEVYLKVREKVGAGYPVLIKLNASDNLDGGLTIDGAVYAAKKLDAAGIDAIEVSAGTGASGDEGPVRKKIRKPEDEAYNVSLARRVKEEVDSPVMVVGGIRSYEVAEKTIAEDGMDYVAIARPLIREPGLANRWLRGDRGRATCTSCNKCFAPGLKEGGIYCVTEKKEREKAAKKLKEEKRK